MNKTLPLVAALSLGLSCAAQQSAPPAAPPSTSPASTEKSVEAFLRHYFALGEELLAEIRDLLKAKGVAG